ncbi:MAG TPA: cytochrome c1 [Gammaproteobacteria bacterium]|nr:cytochrome c1 [Acidiferrobacteraceae bacterium]HCX88186.1 cytochrome c1 [Gammaproteobacteria bacterium]
MKRLLLLLCMLWAPAGLAAGGGNEHLDSAYIDLADKGSLRRGAHTFVNYCLSCHEASFMRYERMARDLEIDSNTLKQSMMFAADKPGELMTVNMSDQDAKPWFGVVPPDLSLTARSRGPDWIYTYLRGFYRDGSTPTGWNNTLYPNVAMPHVLYEWQGMRKASYETSADGAKVLAGFEQLRPGTMNAQEYDSAIRNLTNFMVYLAEPAKLVRYRIGFWVMVFMLVFVGLSYLLKKEYWRDVH